MTDIMADIASLASKTAEKIKALKTYSLDLPIAMLGVNSAAGLVQRPECRTLPDDLLAAIHDALAHLNKALDAVGQPTAPAGAAVADVRRSADALMTCLGALVGATSPAANEGPGSRAHPSQDQPPAAVPRDFEVSGLVFTDMQQAAGAELTGVFSSARSVLLGCPLPGNTDAYRALCKTLEEVVQLLSSPHGAYLERVVGDIDFGFVTAMAAMYKSVHGRKMAIDELWAEEAKHIKGYIKLEIVVRMMRLVVEEVTHNKINKYLTESFCARRSLSAYNLMKLLDVLIARPHEVPWCNRFVGFHTLSVVATQNLIGTAANDDAINRFVPLVTSRTAVDYKEHYLLRPVQDDVVEEVAAKLVGGIASRMTVNGDCACLVLLVLAGFVPGLIYGLCMDRGCPLANPACAAHPLSRVFCCATISPGVSEIRGEHRRDLLARLLAQPCSDEAWVRAYHSSDLSREWWRAVPPEDVTSGSTVCFGCV
ncbi:unnamed protein product [Pedinophyceae sp. YPF-701]|nr:unnamed protein product [Pedinophyceae sp. YPF-701]